MIRLLANIWFWGTSVGWIILLQQIIPHHYFAAWPWWEFLPAFLGLVLGPILLLNVVLLIAIWVLGWTFRFLRAVWGAVRLFIITMEEQPRG